MASEHHAGPLIGLARIQQLQLLLDLFSSEWITEVIAAEIGLGADDSDQGWLRVVQPESASSDPWKSLHPGVDAGEASAIALALQQRDAGHDVLLLIDDRCGRAEACCQRLALIGTAAVLVLALREQSYCFSDSLVVAVLKAQPRSPV